MLGELRPFFVLLSRVAHRHATEEAKMGRRLLARGGCFRRLLGRPI
jgi:hypothetical protein